MLRGAVKNAQEIPAFRFAPAGMTKFAKFNKLFFYRYLVFFRMRRDIFQTPEHFDIFYGGILQIQIVVLLRF